MIERLRLWIIKKAIGNRTVIANNRIYGTLTVDPVVPGSTALVIGNVIETEPTAPRSLR